jgi:hypothetical protein
MNEEKLKKEEELARHRRLTFKESLDRQIREAQEIKQKSRLESEKYAAIVAEDLKRFKDEEIRKRADILKRYQVENLAREEQVVEKQRQLREEQAKLGEIDARTIEYSRENSLLEQQRLLEMKLRQKEEQKIVEKENTELKKVRDVEKNKEAQEEKRLMMEYAAKLDREAYERDHAFQRRMEKLDAFRQKYQSEGGGKKDKEQQVKFEQFLLREQKKKEDADVLREKKKHEDERQRQQQAMAENDNLLQQKHGQHLRDLENDEVYARKCRADIEALRAEDRRLRELRRAKQREYHQVLDTQLAERKHCLEDMKLMGKREKELNMDVLRKVEQDPVVLSKVLTKANIIARVNKA